MRRITAAMPGRSSAGDDEQAPTEDELSGPESLDEIVLAAAQAAMPADVLARLKCSQSVARASDVFADMPACSACRRAGDGPSARVAASFARGRG